ncbi:MAG: hypothetical protein ACRDWT_16420 [Jatrophihabitantaceae bacterium]
MGGLESRHHPPQTHRSEYLLDGRARTPCGAATTAGPLAAQSPVYACKRPLTTKARDPRRCDCRSIRVDTLDHAVWPQFRGALRQPARLTAIVEQAGDPKRPDIGGDTLSAAIADTAHIITQLQQAIAEEYQSRARTATSRP